MAKAVDITGTQGWVRRLDEHRTGQVWQRISSTGASSIAALPARRKAARSVRGWAGGGAGAAAGHCPLPMRGPAGGAGLLRSAKSQVMCILELLLRTQRFISRRERDPAVPETQ